MSKLFSMLGLCFVLVASAACSRVDPGHVGLKINLYGSERGVDQTTIVTGRVFYNPFSTEFIQYPTHVQRVVWTKTATEGSRNDESITFNSREGVAVNVDVAAAIQFTGELVPNLYVEFRQDAGTLVDGYVRDRLRDAFNTVASTMPVAMIYGEGKAGMVQAVEDAMREELGPKGIVITNVSLVGEPRLPEKVIAAINAVIERKNAALQAKAKVDQMRHEADQKIETARGEAESILIRAKSQAEANTVVARSLTPDLIQFRAIEEWNGVLPTVTGGAVPFISLDRK